MTKGMPAVSPSVARVRPSAAPGIPVTGWDGDRGPESPGCATLTRATPANNTPRYRLNLRSNRCRMPTEPFSDKQYRQRFSKQESLDQKSIQSVALEHALSTRKFEIELYWKRASYFWTFIGAALAGFIAVQASSSNNKTHLSLLLSCLGLVFSFSWLLANRGSKHWQENWENHVDMLEDPVTGPLYKVILTRRPPNGALERIDHLLTGPSAFSVSKINQIISLFMTAIWIILLAHSLPAFSLHAPINWIYALEVGAAVCACALIAFYGRTYQGGYWHKGTIRTAKINNDT